MKIYQHVYYLLFMLITLIMSNGCGTTQSGTAKLYEGDISVPEDLWGRWVPVGSGSSTDLNSKTTVSYTSVDDNLIYKDDSKEYLIRSGCRNTKVTGTVKIKSSLQYDSEVTGRFSNVDVTLQNVNDNSIGGSAHVDDQGAFQVEGIPAGDYAVIVTDRGDNASVVVPSVAVTGNETDIGSVVLDKSSAKFNLKLDWTTDKPFLFAGRTYKGNLSIKNFGSQSASGLSCQISSNSSVVNTVSFVQGQNGVSVDDGKSKLIPVYITLNTFSSPNGRETVNLDVKVKDSNGYQWKETLHLIVYECPLSLNVDGSKAKFKSYLIMPGHSLSSLTLDGIQIEVPYIPDADFYLVLLNLDKNTTSSVSMFFDTTESEVNKIYFTDYNETESKAHKTILNDGLDAVVQPGALGFYRFTSGYFPRLSIKAPNSAVTGKPVTVEMTVTDQDSDRETKFVDFGDGSSVNLCWNSSISHAYFFPGTYTISVQTYDIVTQKKIEETMCINISTIGDRIIDNGMAFNLIQSGDFQMGSPTSEMGRSHNETQHKVSISKNYYIMTTEVTQGQWKDAMGSLPEKVTDCPSCPVTFVSWNDVMEFIKVLNDRYKVHFDLPTEAEWEYAARAGTLTAFFTGDISSFGTDSDMDIAGWYSGNSSSVMHEVGRKKANGWGLYDMHGNVAEWCLDDMITYTADPATDPMGVTNGNHKTIRGGSYRNNAQYSRVARRHYGVSTMGYVDGGFRLVIRP